MNIKIRDIKPSDLPNLTPIEIASFPHAYWETEDFRTVLSDKNNYGLLVETHCEIVAFAIYSLDRKYISIINIAVSPHVRRQKIGFAIIEKLIMSLGKRKEICLTVSDQNLDAQLFFRSMGFKAVNVERNFYGRGHDGYDFVYNVGSPYKYDKSKQLDEVCRGK